MKKRFQRTLAIILTTIMLFSVVFGMPVFAQTANSPLQFNSDGKFTILVFADLQDSVFPRAAMIELMGKALDEVKPDIVVLAGDNVVAFGNVLNEIALKQVLKPIVDRNIRFAYVFGNHDDEYGVSKASMHKTFMSTGLCLTYDAEPSITGFGNCNLPILSSDGSKTAFNLWMIDSNTYTGGNVITHNFDACYDGVHQDQLDWYSRVSEELEAQNGGKVPSLVFQHMIVPEIFDMLKPASSSTPKNKRVSYCGKDYELAFLPEIELPFGPTIIGEKPCPPNFKTEELNTFIARGDVLGIVTGHDHLNSFVARHPSGIDLIQTPGTTFQAAGDDNVRGYRVITLDEGGSYDTQTFRFSDMMSSKDVCLKNNAFVRIPVGIWNIIKGFFHKIFG